MGSDVSTPWPISAIGAAMVMVLSVPIVTQPPMVLALGGSDGVGACGHEAAEREGERETRRSGHETAPGDLDRLLGVLACHVYASRAAR